MEGEEKDKDILNIVYKDAPRSRSMVQRSWGRTTISENIKEGQAVERAFTLFPCRRTGEAGLVSISLPFQGPDS